LIVTFLAVIFAVLIHNVISNCQPDEVTLNVSSEVEQAAGAQGVPVWEVLKYSSDDSWFGNGQEYILEKNTSSFVEHARLFNATIKAYTVVHGSCLGVDRRYQFKNKDTLYELEQSYYPAVSVIGYEVASTENWPTVIFKTDGFAFVLLHFVACVIIIFFWFVLVFED
jgi:hypothetical protein